MAKLYFNESGLSMVKKSLTDASNDLRNAVNSVSLDVPNDFSNASYLRNVKSQLNGIKSKLDSYEDWVVSSIKDINSTFADINHKCGALETIKIVPKEHIVVEK